MLRSRQRLTRLRSWQAGRLSRVRSPQAMVTIVTTMTDRSPRRWREEHTPQTTSQSRQGHAMPRIRPQAGVPGRSRSIHRSSVPESPPACSSQRQTRTRPVATFGQLHQGREVRPEGRGHTAAHPWTRATNRATTPSCGPHPPVQPRADRPVELRIRGRYLGRTDK